MFPRAFLFNNSNPFSLYHCSLCSSTSPNWNFYYNFCTSKKPCHFNLLVVPAHFITVSLSSSLLWSSSPKQKLMSVYFHKAFIAAVYSSSLEDPINRAWIHHFLQELKNIEWRLNLNISVRIFLNHTLFIYSFNCLLQEHLWSIHQMQTL